VFYCQLGNFYVSCSGYCGGSYSIIFAKISNAITPESLYIHRLLARGVKNGSKQSYFDGQGLSGINWFGCFVFIFSSAWPFVFFYYQAGRKTDYKNFLSRKRNTGSVYPE
jgi:hypothetical protein